MCEHLRMDPQDDPEARIRELERPLADRAEELGTGAAHHNASPPPTRPWTYGNAFPPPPPPGPPAPWPGYAEDLLTPGPVPQHIPPPVQTGRILLVLAGVVAVLITAGVLAFVMFTGTVTSGIQTIADDPSSLPTPYVPPIPAAPPVAGPEVAGPGQTVNVAGASYHREVECDGGTVVVSGVENTITVTGHCAAVTVSGVRNTITVDAADTIGVSGFENRVTYRSGEPDIAKSGMDNAVEKG
jgi:hypothetical protein